MSIESGEAIDMVTSSEQTSEPEAVSTVTLHDVCSGVRTLTVEITGFG